MSRSSQQSTYNMTTTSRPANSSSTSTSNTPALRYSTAHSNSSAFSASANPNEDWTKISDLAERRRIQNRIAQRNYRKKLKRRLEDLEKKAASTESSPEPQSAPSTSSYSAAPTSQASIIEAPQPLQIISPTSSASPVPSAESIVRPSSASSAYLTATSNFDESAIFTPQYRHTYTASPPIMSYPTPPMSNESFSQYSPTPSYAGGYAVSPPPSDFPPHFHHSPALSSAQSAVSSEGVSIKSEYFDEDVSQFNLNYSPLDNQIGGQFIDCSNPSTANTAATTTAPFPNDPTIYAPLSQDFDSLDPFEGTSIVSPDFWALYPDAPQFISV